MTLSPEQMASFESVCRPVIKWINDNAHPHVTVIVTTDSAEATEGLACIRTPDYIRD